VFWKRTHDRIVATKRRVDDMGLQNSIMDNMNYNMLLILVMAFFVIFSAESLLNYFGQCA
jgi:hypothetical protein